jgi:O-antigen ligase
MPAGAKKKRRKIKRAVGQKSAISHSAWQLALIAVLAATPLGMMNGVFLSHDVAPKVLAVLCGAAGMLFLLPQWVSGLNILARRRAGQLLLLLICGQFVSLLLSTSVSEQIPLSLAGTVWRRLGLVEQAAILVLACGAACVAARDRRWTRILIRSMVICGGVAAFYAIAQYFGLDPFLERSLYAIDYFGSVARPPATMGHALYFGAYESPVILLGLALHGAEVERRWKVLIIACVLAGVTAVVLSGTRSALLALAAGFLYFILRGPIANHPSSRRKLVASAAVLATAFVVFVLSPPGANLRNRIRQWPEEWGGPRIEMWRESPALLTGHLLTGIGPENFGGAFRKVQSARLSQEFPDFYQETPHNAFLDALCAQGLPGLFILLAVAALPWVARTQSGTTGNSEVTGYRSAMLGLIVASLFASFTLVAALYFWLLAALAAGSADAEEGITTPVRVPAMAQLAAAVVACLFIVAGISLALQDYEWSELAFAVDNKSLRRATAAFSTAEAASLGLPGYELFASREFAILGRALGSGADSAASWQMAAEASVLAESRGEDRFNAAYQSSVLAVANTDIARAESEARATVMLAPNWYKAHLLLSQILQISGKTADAAKEAAISKTLGWKSPN